MSIDTKNVFKVLGALWRRMLPTSALFRSWFAGGCLGVALTLALLNPLMCLLHCAFWEQAHSEAELRAQAFNCAMLHHHHMPEVVVDALPDDLPGVGITLQLPRAFYEMSLTIASIGVLLILVHRFLRLALLRCIFVDRAPLDPPPKLLLF